jgi:3-hydroxyisobutyrate dehydrogenase
MLKETKVGWIGLGVMGSSMAKHIQDAGYSLSVYSRTKEKASFLLNQGAKWENSPAELVNKVDFVFSMVGYPEDVQNIYFGNNGIFSGYCTDKILIDMTTSKPEIAETVALHGKEHGAYALDAPVSGGDIGAKNRSLAIMCGGEKNIYEKAYPLLEEMGANIQYFGGAGSGQRVKMSNQILIASTMIGTVESLLYAESAKLDLEKVIGLIGQGAAGCWSITNLGPRMINQDWEPGFYVEHFIKDIGIALDDAQKMGLNLKGLELASSFYQRVQDAGYQKKGTQVLLKVLKSLNDQSCSFAKRGFPNP